MLHPRSLLCRILFVGISLAAVASVGTCFAGAFTLGDLVVSRVGDGSTALGNTGNAVSLLEFNTSGSLIQTVGLSTQGSGLQISGTATSEGALSQYNGVFTVAGYLPPFTGSGSLANRTDAQAPRAVQTVGVNGTIGTATPVSAMSGNNIRGGVTTSTGVYLSGGITGTVYRSGGTNTTIQSAETTTRVIQIQNGNLYYSSSTGTSGIYGFTGVPTAATTPTTILSGVTGEGGSPYDFDFSPNGSTLYVADSSIGIQKFTLTGGVWSLAYNITTGSGTTGLAVDFSGANPIVYAVNPSTLFKYVDTGSAGSATSIASAGSNYVFDGLATVPEPTACAAMIFGLGVLLGAGRMRRVQRPV